MLTVNGLDLAITTWNGDASGRPLVVLHGFLEQGPAWAQVAEHLERPVHALDHRGHGRSDHVGAGGFYHFWDYVSDVDGVLEQLSPDAPVHLLGHSMGGSIACLYAGSRPERVERLVLVEGLGPPDTTSSLVDRARLFLHHRRVGTPHGKPFADVAEAAARLVRFNPALAPGTAVFLAARQLEDVPGGLQWRWDARHRSRAPRPFVEEHFNAFLREITAPTLVVAGSRSTYPRFERAVHLQDATTLLLEAGHLVHHDAPDALATAVSQHLGP